MRVKKFKTIGGGITLTMNVEDGTCNIQSDKILKLRNLGTMLGFDKTATIVANTLTKSPSTVNINRGLHYISI